ncbi:hypothetical protein ACFQ3P_38945 [Paraburkholderia sabiae]|uniref:Uncharacterized protein n=1 Tax=Paraburkholderia sabiae TaxID=273251 RepID=A0ABU9QQD2_9BURK|nr:hypothetical protein [Paraburkholderia sabiae]WJZ79411.1 hypothetical protein QEN71_42140 [Paraburkholderia sabiae]CAD6562727.1 hypothetical protein LMG24235_07968 [Paraburkholderia sabiae]
MGLTLGVFHAEARITRDCPALIEIAARLGGYRIYRLVELSKSLSLPEVMIRSHLGDTYPAPGYPPAYKGPLRQRRRGRTAARNA